MPDLSLDLRNLRCVEAVAEYGSFRQAANALCLSQSTVTRRIQLLEHRLRAPVFSRSKTGSRLTAAGEGFLREALIGAGHFREAILMARATAERHHLRLGFVGSIARPRSCALLREYRLLNPQVAVRAEEVTSESGAGAVRAGRLDAAIVLTPPLDGVCETEAFIEERIVLVVHERHRLASSNLIQWSDLHGETILIPREGCGPEMHGLIKSEAPPLATHVSIQDLSFDNLLSMTSMGFGVTLSLASSSFDGSRSVRVVPFPTDGPHLSSHIIWLGTNSNPALSSLVRLLKDSAVIKC